MGPAPERLEHRNVRVWLHPRSCDQAAAAELACRIEVPQPELAALPGHEGLLPLHPGQPCAGGAQGRVAAEVGWHHQRLGLATFQPNSHQLVAARTFLTAAFQYADPAVAAGIDQAAAVGTWWAEPSRLAIAAIELQQPEAAVTVVAEHRYWPAIPPAAQGRTAATVFMHPAAQIPAARG